MTDKTLTTEPCPKGLKDRWCVGEAAYFQYECWMSHASNDAELWYRTQQRVEIIDDGEELYDSVPGVDTLLGRSEIGQPRCYTIRFKDACLSGLNIRPPKVD